MKIRSGIVAKTLVVFSFCVLLATVSDKHNGANAFENPKIKNANGASLYYRNRLLANQDRYSSRRPDANHIRAVNGCDMRQGNSDLGIWNYSGAAAKHGSHG